MRPAVSLRGVSKRYRIYPRQRHRLLEAATFGLVRRSRDFWALRDIDLDVHPGTSLGILGRNGAGKSTLLEIISGVLQPTSGTVRTEGKVVMLQMGAGMNPEFTGRENVMLNGLILGIDRRKILERFDEIEAFADIGEFMDQPVKTYSSGMRARLGFAVAINVEPDILIVDETLSVGDAVFRHMCLQKMKEMRDRGTTILFVSHGLGQVKSFCNRAILLHEGRLLFDGETAETLDRYQALLSEIEARRERGGRADYAADGENGGAAPAFREDAGLERRPAGFRHGTGEARLAGVEVLDGRGAPAESVDPNSPVTVRVHLEYLRDVEASVLAIALRNHMGLDVFSTDTNLEKRRLGRRRAGERLIVDFAFESMPLRHGTYSVSAGVLDGANRNVHLDWVDVAAAFRVERPENRRAIPGLFHLPARVTLHEPGEPGEGG
ncbi:ABC transporter related [Rubrobacter xylanophilus DSM 9941]|uniref:ABC transporter related n=1 Tax=Rubrobacter xylanophilus (strain DSM 9941 / JCM 11954 / NBRC 16129 / PRD-1) TaxID=266117 RepID=Q1ARF4_RUBXD|nr:ABC transporter ATP-binding protein [Rubrobacter xylanophilus]ABG06024.1 ABC transporter related [Rubrobacter xylanophilus DSM 9941]